MLQPPYRTEGHVEVEVEVEKDTWFCPLQHASGEKATILNDQPPLRGRRVTGLGITHGFNISLQQFRVLSWTAGPYERSVLREYISFMWCQHVGWNNSDRVSETFSAIIYGLYSFTNCGTTRICMENNAPDNTIQLGRVRAE